MKIVLFLCISLHLNFSFADHLRCYGNLKIKDGRNKIHSSNSGIIISRNESSVLTVVDGKNRNIATAYPWMSIQVKSLVSVKEQKKKKIKIETDGMNWFFISKSEQSGKKEEIRCSVEEAEND